MSKYILFFILFYSCCVKAQLPAKKVVADSVQNINAEMEEDEILFLPHQINIDTLPTNPILFKRNFHDEQKLYRSNKLKVAIFVDPTIWKKKTSSINSEEEFYFKDNSGFSKARFFTVADTSFKLQDIVNLALNSARTIYFDAEIFKAEYRTVNANKILFVEISIKVKKRKARILHYFYKGSDGITQISLAIAAKILKKYRFIYESFLNGFVITENEKK